MGMEAECRCCWEGGAAQVKALLESRELILRGGLKRQIPIADIRAVEVDGDDLVIAADENYRLALGAPKAARWKAKIETPPPSLRAKLGLGGEDAAWVIGRIDDDALRDAVSGAVTEAAQAKIAIAQHALDAALGGVEDRALGGAGEFVEKAHDRLLL